MKKSPSMKKGLINEFLHEAESTRKLLSAIPDSSLDFRPQPKLWSVAELASHIAEIYAWFDSVFNADEFDLSSFSYDKGDISRTENILNKFEENVGTAWLALENSDENTYLDGWRMVWGTREIIPESPRIGMVRGLLFNHIYHHRGELVAHLRTSGHKVPGLYGPTFEESQLNI